MDKKKIKAIEADLDSHLSASFRCNDKIEIKKSNKNDGGLYSSSNFVKVMIEISDRENGKYHQIEATLDTGANVGLLLPSRVLNQLGLKPEPDSPAQVIGVTDTEPQMQKRAKIFFGINNHKLSTSAFLSDTLPVPLLGNHILKLFDLTIKNGIATLLVPNTKEGKFDEK